MEKGLKTAKFQFIGQTICIMGSGDFNSLLPIFLCLSYAGTNANHLAQ